MKTSFVMFILIGILVISCSKDKETLKPDLITIEATDLTYNSAICGGSINSDGGAKISERGICWSISHNPTINDNKLIDSTTLASNFSVKLTKLLFINMPIYVRAYAINNQGISYGNEITFTLWLNYPESSVTDIDNNTYSSVRIGNQIWMKENLKVTHFRNGEPIENFKLQNDTQWLNTTKGAYCYYNDNSENTEKYGCLYNGYAITDNRNICPSGWHIPTKKDWETLIDYLGGISSAGEMLRSQDYWDNLTGYTTDMSGFSALPGGFRSHSMSENIYTTYFDLNSLGVFWSQDEFTSYDNGMWYFQVTNTGVYVRNNVTKKCGLSIRCIKD